MRIQTTPGRAVLIVSFFVALSVLSTAGTGATEPVDGPPTEDAWRDAPMTQLRRNVRDGCQAKEIIVRDGTHWLRVTCSSQLGWLWPTASILSGEATDVTTAFADNWVRVTMPVRRGDRRVVLAARAIGISAVWLRSAEQPVVVVN